MRTFFEADDFCYSYYRLADDVFIYSGEIKNWSSLGILYSLINDNKAVGKSQGPVIGACPYYKAEIK